MTPHHHWKFGASTMRRIVESETPMLSPFEIFTDCTQAHLDANRDWLQPRFQDPASGLLTITIQSFLIRQNGLIILVDSCSGNDKAARERPVFRNAHWPWLQRLAEAGVKPEDVDIVLCSHLHVDHVGWNTRLDNGRWVPTFPNARYVFGKTDYDHFLSLDRDPQKGPAIGGALRDSVLPIVEAGLCQMVDGTETIEEHLSLTRAPGHSPGHVLIDLASQGRHALFSGDIIHHVIQVYHPTWNSFACLDQAAARQSRRMTLERCAGSGALLMPQHFGAPHICHIDAKGDGFTPRFL
jgi:glyoxylase-like metal-dependent hydrolase (beta-lactamase superfamily II)